MALFFTKGVHCKYKLVLKYVYVCLEKYSGPYCHANIDMFAYVARRSAGVYLIQYDIFANWLESP